MKRFFTLAFLVATQVVFSAELFPDGKPLSMTIGDRIEPGSTVGGYPIWNGEGKWRYLESAKWDTTGVVVGLGRATVFQTENKQFVATMSVIGNLALAPSRDWTDEPCKRDDYLFKSLSGGPFRNINCVSINHIVGYPGNVTGKDAEAFAFFKEQGIDVPPTVIRVTFTRYTDSMRRYEVRLSINPEIVGFQRDTGTVWGQNSWHKTQAMNNPDKKKFIDELSAWASAFAKQMDPAFDKEPNAFASIPTWRKGVDVTLKLDEPKKKVTLD